MCVKVVTGLDGTRRIEIHTGIASKLFCFIEARLDFDEYAGQFRNPIKELGLYASPEEAERAAYLETRWLQEDSN